MFPSQRTAGLLALSLLASLSGAGVGPKDWGKLPDGTPVHLYTIQSEGITARISDYGATIQSLVVPDKEGKPRDVVLGYSDIEGYLGQPGSYFGALVGRYSNRIGKARFTLDGKTYTLAANNGPNTLHGGLKGYDKRVWKVVDAKPDRIVLALTDPAGTEGFPGTVKVMVRYDVSKGAIRVSYSATTDQATPLSLTQHSYFDLEGEGANSGADTVLQLKAHRYVPVDATLIPTGELSSVIGTPFDFLAPTAISDRVGALHPQIDFGAGYDHTFVVDGKPGTFRMAALAKAPRNGIQMQVWTTEPGVQLYTGNFLDNSQVGKSGRRYNYRGAFCLETQAFPDSPNKKSFPTGILRPGQSWRSMTEYRFSASE
ncbi:galactose mutarotase [bacterium]|nr:MAG: galactose mutarotase [bacterium]